MLREVLRYAWGVRETKGQDPTAGFDQKRVRVAVIATGEFHDHIPPCKTSGQSNGRHGGLCAGVDHTHPFHAGDSADDAFSELNFYLSWCAEAQCLLRLFGNGFDGGPEVMAQNHRAPRADVVNVAVAVDIAEISTLGAGKEDRITADAFKGSHRRIDATWDAELCSLNECG